jgi:single-stranded DNA-binding protein
MGTCTGRERYVRGSDHRPVTASETGLSLRVFARGRGPGPYNVGIILDDGTRTVVTYRTWKYKYKPLIKGDPLSDKSYGVVIGTVQFDPKRERTVNEQVVCDVTIKAANLPVNPDGTQKLVSITIWPEFAYAWQNIKKGDFVVADGEIRTSTGQNEDGSPRQYINWSPSAIFLGVAEVRAPRQVVQAPTQVLAQPAAAQPLAQPLAQPVAQPVAQPAAAQPVAAPTSSVF